MAATYGRLTGRAGVCLTTLGPGALNLTTSAAYAHLGAMPMVIITGQKAIRSSRQARFQIVDIVATMRPLTKMATQIVSAQSIPTLVRDAFRVAQQERPGPVHLELPEDIAADEARGRNHSSAYRRDSDCAHSCHRARRRHDHGCQAASRHVGRRSQPPAARRALVRLRHARRHSVFHHPDGEGRRQCGLQSLHRHRRAIGTGLGSRGDRPGRPDHFDRPRHRGEATLPDGTRAARR